MPRGNKPESRFDVMADLCILAGQAVMQVGSNDLQAAMRVVLGILGRELASRTVEAATIAPAKVAPAKSRRPSRRARTEQIAPCA